MNKSFVIFGPAHGGKSTLAGYLLAKAKLDFDAFGTMASIKKFLGSKYEGSQKYAYLVDRHSDERNRENKPKSDERGTSLYTHTESITLDSIGDIAVLDTPGAEHQLKERLRGIYYGDIGVFLIELSKLTQEPRLNVGLRDFLTPLFTWLKLGRSHDNIIVLFSKMDEVEFSADEFNRGRRILDTLIGTTSVVPIPVAIDVDNDTDHNVCQRSSYLDWYNGPIFIDAIKEKLRGADADDRSQSFFMHVERIYDMQHIGQVTQGKLLEGCLSVGQQIKVAPVNYHNKQFRELTATVDNLRIVKGEDKPFVTAGEIVGVKLSDVRLNGRRCEKDEFDAISTTSIMADTERLLSGRILTFRLNDPFDGARFGISDTVRVTWFGKLIACSVVLKKASPDTCILTLELETLVAALPVANQQGPLRFTDFLLVSPSEHFVPAKLLGIANAVSLTAPLPEGLDPSVYFINMDLSVENGRMQFPCRRLVKPIVSQIRAFYRRHDKELNSLIEDISLDLRETYDPIHYERV